MGLILDLFENCDWKKTSVMFSPVLKWVGTESYVLNKKPQKKRAEICLSFRLPFTKKCPIDCPPASVPSMGSAWEVGGGGERVRKPGVRSSSIFALDQLASEPVSTSAKRG